jgi:hypothetical protein
MNVHAINSVLFKMTQELSFPRGIRKTQPEELAPSSTFLVQRLSHVGQTLNNPTVSFYREMEKFIGKLLVRAE